MGKPKTVIESITQLESKEAGMTITCYREENNKDFDHNLNMKVIGQIVNKEHKTLYALAEKLLSIHRMNAVEVRNKIGHGVHLFKDFSNEVEIKSGDTVEYVRCEDGCTVSKAMDQPRPRLCTVCGCPEDEEA